MVMKENTVWRCTCKLANGMIFCVQRQLVMSANKAVSSYIAYLLSADIVFIAKKMLTFLSLDATTNS